jgi:hypothetical protein
MRTMILPAGDAAELSATMVSSINTEVQIIRENRVGKRRG